MEWHQGDFIELAQQLEIPNIAFTANYTFNGPLLVMGGGAALSVKEKFPRIDKTLGKHIAYRRTANNLFGPYYIQAVETKDTEGFFGDEYDNPAITIIAVQVKHHWRDSGDWDLTVQSLKYLKEYLDDVRLEGKNDRAVLNCPLIGLGGFQDREQEVRDMVEKTLRGVDIYVCTL